MSRKRHACVPCAARDKNNRPCSKYCAPGKLFCRVHDPDKKATGVVAQQQTDDPLVVVQRLMKSRKEEVRLKAADLYVKLLERAPRRRDDGDTPLELWNQDELQELDVALKALDAVETRVRRRLCPHEQRPTPGVNTILLEEVTAVAPLVELDDPTDDGIDVLDENTPFELDEVGL